jgi:group I intron endonuclease
MEAIHMKGYTIYCHTMNNKKYIGYTEKSIEVRLREHIKDSENGSTTYFHRAIRKHGHDKIVTEKLDECTTQEEAKKKETFYIKKYKTFDNGYNMTKGGDGGNTKKKYTKSQMKAWSKNRSRLSSGMNNGNARPDITKEDIIYELCDYIKSEKKYGQHVLRKEIDYELKNRLNVSPTMVLNRGISNYTELIKLVNNNLKSNEHIKYDPYYRSEDERKVLSQKSSQWAWVTDGYSNQKVKVSAIDIYLAENKNYRRGRTLKNENR